MNPATFINQRRWEDMPAASTAADIPSRARKSAAANLIRTFV
jgi:hypothetical protein